jgi:hypothetical protein
MSISVGTGSHRVVCGVRLFAASKASNEAAIRRLSAPPDLQGEPTEQTCPLVIRRVRSSEITSDHLSETQLRDKNSWAGSNSRLEPAAGCGPFVA